MIKKFVLMREKTGTFRNNVLIDNFSFGSTVPTPAYAKTIDNAAIMSRRLAMDQRQPGERLIPVSVAVSR